MPRYTDAFKARVIEMILSGMTREQVHRTLNVNRWTIRRWLADQGLDQETLTEARLDNLNQLKTEVSRLSRALQQEREKVARLEAQLRQGRFVASQAPDHPAIEHWMSA